MRKLLTLLAVAGMVAGCDWWRPIGVGLVIEEVLDGGGDGLEGPGPGGSGSDPAPPPPSVIPPACGGHPVFCDGPPGWEHRP
jgi:hypothetical protein